MKLATFASGCFWCTEAVFLRLKGVEKVVSGYTGGFVKNPPYREVCEGSTGHAEGIHIQYDEQVITYQELLEVFFATHDPTTLNRQVYDVGTQYRSAIFYHSEEQKKAANEYIAYLNMSNVFPDPIVTEVTAFEVFYEAEEEHQDFYNNNQEMRYCQVIIDPKLNKLNKLFKEKLR
ncbi:MAG: peptide-methionine (S)-S-oxide reductase MsrA [Flavobacteriaceae bacterium]|nr:peptide-methionine (S)-S-oxide reductase MsrA [Flavobacteriaceae bacterium]